MSRIWHLWWIFFALAFAVSAQAQDVDCKNPRAQIEMTYCAELDWQEADAELNAAYKAAMSSMKEIDANLPKDLRGATGFLQDAQRSWIPFRDNACASYGFLARGGSMEPMLIYSCWAELTRKRTAELIELAQGLGN